MKELVVFNLDTGEVVRRFDVTGKSDAYISKLEDGLLNRVDLDKYSVEVRTK